MAAQGERDGKGRRRGVAGKLLGVCDSGNQGEGIPQMGHMDQRSLTVTKANVSQTCMSSGKCITKRRKSQPDSRRIRQRQLDFQSIIPWKINIQSLPEDIVPMITSKLTLREAAQMSALSSMWRQAWMLHPNLYLDIKTVLGSNACTKGMCSVLSIGILTINKFIERVNAILKNHCGTHVDKFAVKFGLSMEHANHINRWVSFAVASKAKTVIFNLSPNRRRFSPDHYEFPFQLFGGQNGSYLQSLRLDSVALGPSSDFCGFPNLKMLALDNVIVSQNLHHLLSKCLMLEWLSIRKCYGQLYLRVLEPLCRLQYLCLQDCAFDNIELHAPRLITFDYTGSDTVINLNECLKLKTAILRLDVTETLEYILTEIPNMLPHVETLSIELCIENEISGFVQSPLKFIRLRHLTMEITCSGSTNSIFQLAYLLEAAPLLEDLQLKMFCSYSACLAIDLDDIMDLPHYHLKTVCITGFCGNGGQVELVKYILKNALILERLIVKLDWKSKGSITGVDGRFGRMQAKEILVPLDMNGVLTIL